jgi:hypothetical protein
MTKQSSSAKNHNQSERIIINQKDGGETVQFSKDGHRLEAPNPWPKPPEKTNPPEAKGKQQKPEK